MEAQRKGLEADPVGAIKLLVWAERRGDGAVAWLQGKVMHCAAIFQIQYQQRGLLADALFAGALRAFADGWFMFGSQYFKWLAGNHPAFDLFCLCAYQRIGFSLQGKRTKLLWAVAAV